jgi:uncharacterized protein (DUF302 family)
MKRDRDLTGTEAGLAWCARRMQGEIDMTRLLLVLALVVTALPAWAQDNADFVVKPSAHTVQETMDRLEAIVLDKEFKVLARIDHAALAQSVDMTLAPAQVLVFGKPALGTPLMEKNPMIGLDLPLKVIVYQDAAGDVWLAYTRPEVLVAQRYGIAGEDERIAMMNKGLGAMTDAATAAGG